MSLIEPKPSGKTDNQKAPSPDIEQFLHLFAGIDDWHFPGYEPLDYPPLQVADCGHGVTLVAPPYGSATCFPTSIGMAATWNRDLIEEVGRALGRESRAKKCGVLLGPMVNLHRLPCGGRNYETFSEDPVLTGKLAAAIIRGLQAEGTGACIKGFVCNNQQHDQHDTSAMVDDRTLRELYLKAFAIAIEEAKPWSAMSCYNPVNGEYTSDSHYWMEEVLRQELGHEAFIVSDWRGIKGDGAITSGIDMEMPGSGKFLTAAKLREALDDGRITSEDIIERAGRVLKLHERCAAARLGDERYSPPELDSPRHRDLCRRVAEESIVLLKNEDKMLPLERGRIKRLAVIGPNASSARLGGGGSASVSPFYSVSPLEGISRVAGQAIEVSYEEGCGLGNDTPAVPAGYLAPENGVFGQGLSAQYFDIHAYEQEAGEPVYVAASPQVDFSWGWAAPADGVPREHYAIRWQGRMKVPDSGEYTFTLSTQEGVAKAWLDGELILDAWSSWDEGNFEDNYTNRHATFHTQLQADDEAELRIEYRKTGTRGGIHFGWLRPHGKDGIEAAVELAQQSDAVILVCGLCNIFEGGAYDRQQFELPQPQEELIKRVAAANPRTVVVLKNGTPVAMAGWLGKVPAVVEAFYPGQEGGNALANILFGEVNPSGKLPDTVPHSWDEVPSMKYYPGQNNKAYYLEGLMVGYRHYDAAGTEPVFPFGFGLSYTSFAYTAPSVNRAHLTPDTDLIVSVEVQNTGDRQGRETVQLYLEMHEREAYRPPRQLIDFKKVELNPGEKATVTFTVPYQLLLTYNPEDGAWKLEYERFSLATGPHSRDLQKIVITASEEA